MAGKDLGDSTLRGAPQDWPAVVTTLLSLSEVPEIDFLRYGAMPAYIYGCIYMARRFRRRLNLDQIF